MTGLAPLEADDLAAVEIVDPEHGKCFLTPKDELAQGGRTDCDFAGRPHWSDKNNAAPDFDGRRVLGKKTPIFHSNPLPRNTEQLWSGTKLATESNLIQVNPVCFRPAVAF
jgi:hypothetical protein